VLTVADLIAISQGLNALNAATQIAKAMLGLRDSAKLLENTVKLNSEILSVQTALANAQEEQTALVQTISDLRVCPGRLGGVAELSQHQADESETQKGKRLAVEIFPILGRPSAAVEPGEGALDNPAFG